MEININKWELFKNYINSNNNITRQGILKNVSGGNTIDNYINLTRNAGFIKRIRHGVYVLECKIPDNVTSNLIQKIAYYDDSKKIKYLRKIKLENIIKK